MRNIHLATISLAFATILAGCATTSDEAGDVIDPKDPCGAQGYTSLLGNNLAAITLPADLNDRIVGPDSAVTTDFDPSRLNIETTQDGLIVGLSCG